MSRYNAYCGLYCGACCSMITNDKANNVESALKMQTDAKELPCGGCDADSQSNCEFVTCCKEHGVDSCAFCPEFPCSMLMKFKDEEWEHHKVVLDNLSRIKEIGLQAWLAEQKEYWKCPQCGQRTQWYQKQCNICQTEIVNYM